ncbi:DUF4124 domain-containing protein [Variovorax terrae]|uniref:DUF4124 domain-containing protein n=1 Tax=Variovorax terrae TaxID=2923278 RepID=A0A9X1VVF4_9BURK|nr:DUF4124 domain-containing protein [Variovorax terrae]MCJ0762602.1 DUF4124 domain-containing protein [Variovorax terrae]
MKALAVCLLTLACAAAQAQVYRCVEAGTGRISYTDEHCPVGSANGSRLIEARKSPEAIEQERQRAREAQQQQYLRQEHEARMQSLDAERQRQDAATAAAAAWAGGAGCAEARREAEAIAGRAVGLTLDNPELAQAQYQADLACLGPEQAALNAQAFGGGYYGTSPLIAGGWFYRPHRVRSFRFHSVMPLPPQRWRGVTRMSSGRLR